MPGSGVVTMIDQEGNPRDVPTDAVASAVQTGWRVQSEGDRTARLQGEALEHDYGGVSGAVASGATAFARGATLGLSDVGIRAAGGGERIRKLKQVNPGVSTVGEIAGTIAPALVTGGGSLGALAARSPAALAARAGAGFEAAEGAGLIRQLGAAAARTGTEGAILGAGQGLSNAALSEDPLTVERIFSEVSSGALHGAEIGAAAGVGGKLLDKGLARARTAMDDIANAASKRSAAVSDDLATLDMKGLNAARKGELDAIEAARIPERKALADELGAFRKELKERKVWLATQGSEDVEIRTIGKQSLTADRQLDNILDNPKYLAERPQSALSALQKQEHALEQLTGKADDLRVTFAADTSGTRVQALEDATKALERNRALQGKIRELTADPMSERLQAINDAKDVLQSGGAKKGIAEQMLGGSAFSAVAGAARAIPVIGPMLAPFAGAKAADFVSSKLFGRVGNAAAASTERTAKAISSFLGGAQKVVPLAPPLATRVLQATTFAPLQEKPAPRGDVATTKPSARSTLADAYKQRTDEIKAMVEPSPDGNLYMRHSVRQKVAARLAPIGHSSPQLADKLESMAARQIEFLAGKIPRKPDMIGMSMGPDSWRPSDMEMRKWANYVSAATDPSGIEDRLASGSITPEDGEVMRELYPERLAHIVSEVTQNLPKLRKTLPYSRRLAFSILTGVAVDPAMDPRVLTVLQSAYSAEPEVSGTTGSMPQPQFGSVSKSVPEPTPAQSRAG